MKERQTHKHTQRDHPKPVHLGEAVKWPLPPSLSPSCLDSCAGFAPAPLGSRGTSLFVLCSVSPSPAPLSLCLCL